MTRIKDTSKMRICGIPISVFDNLNDFDYASLYPSIYRQFNLGPNTQIGMVYIDDHINEHENRQRDKTYSRGGQFFEDFQSHVWLEVGTRWFNLADFTELLHDVQQFFKEVCMPTYGLKVYDPNGYIDPMYIANGPLPHVGMIFDDDNIHIDKYVLFDYNKAMEWRNYATSHPNQRFE